MNRTTREGIIRTELVTHNARFGMAINEPDELIKRICDAEEEQDQRDAQARFEKERNDMNREFQISPLAEKRPNDR